MCENIFTELKFYQNEIPEIDKLIAVIQQMIRDSKYMLEDIVQEIIDHITNYSETNSADSDKFNDSSLTAYSVIENLIGVLEVNDLNCQRIRNFVYFFESYTGYDRLILDFKNFLSESERKQLIKDGKMIFGSNGTEDWR
jgi:hypothetical protein